MNVYEFKGRILRMMGKYQDSLEAYEKALSLDLFNFNYKRIIA